MKQAHLRQIIRKLLSTINKIFEKWKVDRKRKETNNYGSMSYRVDVLRSYEKVGQDKDMI